MTAWVLGLFVAACHAKFAGPYECVPGYASCVQAQENLCETNTQNDALNCGGCSNTPAGAGTACHVGAPCVDSGCGAGATQIAALQSGSQTPIIANTSGIFWSDQSDIYWLPSSGATSTTVATNVFSCGQAASFAVDSTSVYYFSNSTACGQGVCSGLVKAPLSGAAPTFLLQSQNTSTFQCASIALSADGSELYWLTSASAGSTTTLSLDKISLAGTSASPTTVATEQSANGSSSNRLVVTGAAAIFEVNSTNNQSAFQVVPLSGGSATVVPLPPNSQGLEAFTADSSNIYFLGSGCPCNNNNQGGTSSGLPIGALGKVPIDGSVGTILTQFTGEAGGIAMDTSGGYVYFSTDTAAWKTPVTGGGAIPVAGNLTSGLPGSLCTGCGGSYDQYPIAIGVDASHVYLADHAANVNALLEVPK